MPCIFCHTELAPMRILQDGQFCSDEHRKQWESLEGRVDFLAPALALAMPNVVSGDIPAKRIPDASTLAHGDLPDLRFATIRTHGLTLFTGEFAPATDPLPLPFPKASKPTEMTPVPRPAMSFPAKTWIVR